MRRPTKHGVVLVLGFGCSVAFLGLAFGGLDVSRLLQAVRKAALWPWMPMAILCYLAGHVVRGLRCKWMVSREADLSLATGTHVVVIGYAVNNILPTRLGEFARAGVLAERTGLPYAQALTVTAVERILDGLTLLVLLVVTVLIVPAQGWVAATLQFAGVIFGVALAAVVLAVACPGYLLTLTSRLANRMPPRLRDGLVRLANSVINGVGFLRRSRDAWRVCLVSLAVWLLEGGMFLCLLPSVGIPVSFWTAILAMTVTNLGILVPSSPGYIGPFHFFCMQALVATGVSEETGLIYAVLVHLAFYVPITAWGFASMLAYGLTLGRTMALRREAEPLAELPESLQGVGTPLWQEQASARADRSTPFLRALVEAIVPGGDQPPDAGRRGTIDRTAAFVQGQIAALPARLQTMFAVGMTGFRLITRVVCFRSFCGMALPRRRRWLGRWAYGRVALARQLFRGVRSTALLAYFELMPPNGPAEETDAAPAEARPPAWQEGD